MPVQVNLPKPEQQIIVVTFQLGSQTYALPIAPVRQIIEMVKITPLPRVNQTITGVINFHGVLVPVVNMRSLLDLEEIAFTLFTPIILVYISERLVGLIVDKVLDVLELQVDQVIDPNKILIKEMGETPVLQGLIHAKGESILLLNTEHLFKPSQSRALSEVISTQTQNILHTNMDGVDKLPAPELPNTKDAEKVSRSEPDPQPAQPSKKQRAKTVAKAKITQEASS